MFKKFYDPLLFSINNFIPYKKGRTKLTEIKRGIAEGNEAVSRVASATPFLRQSRTKGKDNVQIHGKRKIQRIKSVAKFNNKDNMQAL